MRSHSPAASVLRTKPRLCAAHAYRRSAPRSRATREAILFSNPSCRSFENGRLFGSAQTRSTRRGAAGGGVAVQAGRPQTAAIRPSAAALEREDIEHASRGRALGQVGHGVDETEGPGAVARVELAGHD